MKNLRVILSPLVVVLTVALMIWMTIRTEPDPSPLPSTIPAVDDFDEEADWDEPDEDEEPDRPGRRFDGGSANAHYHQRSAMEGPDLDKQHAAEFAAMFADRLSHRHRSEGVRHLVIAAPPEFLGLLRDKLSDEIAEIVLAEVPKRLTDATPEEIGQRLVEAW